MTGTKRLLWIVISIVVITVGLVLCFYYFHAFSDAKSKDLLVTESAKALLQVAAIAALGGWLKFLYEEVTEQRRQAEKLREQERASETATNEIRKELLNDLIAARSRVEEVRIKYRIEESLNPIEQYRSAILAILDARLSLARMWNAIETSSYLFSSSQEINNNINEMKVYLDELINEYESQIRELRGLPEVEIVSRLRKQNVFGDFVSNAATSNYGTRFFAGAYRPAVTEIRKQVLRARQIHIEDEVDDR